MTLARPDLLRSSVTRCDPMRSPAGSAEPFPLGDWAPAVEAREGPEEYVVKAELPEVRKEDVRVTIKNGVLSIEGERRRTFCTFVRCLAVPEDADLKSVQADFDHGVLSIHLAKSERAKPNTRRRRSAP